MGSEKISDAEILSNVLNALDITANKLAVKAEYKSASTVYHVLNGENNISTAMAEKIVELYPQVNILYLIRGEEPIILDRGKSIGQANFFGNEKASYDTVPQTLLDIKELLQDVLQELRDKN